MNYMRHIFYPEDGAMTEKFDAEAEFNALLSNAIDFVDSAIEQIDKRPKNSIVEMYTAVELFLKARLMKEHWSLIVTHHSLDVKKFKKGDFSSITFMECCSRLQDVAQAPVPQTARENFDRLRMHRNRIVHFAHTGLAAEGAIRGQIFAELWASWRELFKLLTIDWKEHFTGASHLLHDLQRRILGKSGYLQASFDHLKGEIEKRKASGTDFTVCGACKFESAFFSKAHSWGLDFTCMVCECDTTRTVPTNATILCPTCTQDFQFINSIESTVHSISFQKVECPQCQTELNSESVLAQCKEKFGDGDDWCDSGRGPYIAYCHKCQIDEPSAFFIDGHWTCVSCFERGYGAMHCEQCGTLATGDKQMMQYIGCHLCQNTAANKEHSLYGEPTASFFQL